MIRLEEISKRYPGGHEALTDVSLEINAGEMVYITGHSGAGKSTLLKLIAAIERPSTGALWFHEQNISRIQRRSIPWLRRNFGLIFQDHKLLFDRNAIHNVLLPLEIAGFARHDAFARARAALDKVGLLSRERAMPVTLSGGEQQLLCIARAIATHPPLLLADEPTGNLDSEATASIMRIFREFNRTGTTVIVSSHDPAAILPGTGRVIQLDHGRVLP